MMPGKSYLSLEKLEHGGPPHLPIGPSGQSIPCLHCPKTFSGPTEMRSHLMSEHIMGTHLAEEPAKENSDNLKTEQALHKVTIGQTATVIDKKSVIDWSDVSAVMVEYLSDSGKSPSIKEVPCSDNEDDELSDVEDSDFQMEDEEELSDDNNSHKCSRCGVSFPTPTSLKDHVVSSHLTLPKSALKCPHCKVGQHNSRQLELHVDICPHNPKLAMFCSLCGMHYVKAKDMETHIRRMHYDKDAQTLEEAILTSISKSQAKEYKCKLCPFTSKVPRSIVAHEKRHEGVRNFKCELCTKAFFCQGALNSHLKVHEQNYGCSQCNKTFATKKQQEEHAKKHARFICEVCNKVYKKKDMFEKHQLTHTEEKAHECKDCGKKFQGIPGKSSSSLLKTHIKVVHLKAFPFRCKVCDKGFMSNTILTRHERMHTGDKPFACEHCGKGFLVKYDLEMHIKARHNEDKAYVCVLCGKAFGTAKILQIHTKLTHMTEADKPFSCNYCKYKAKTKQALSIHERTHTGVKPFICSHCGKGFTLKGHLDSHMMIHTGEKPYECPVCHQKFRHKQAMQIHQQRHN